MTKYGAASIPPNSNWVPHTGLDGDYHLCKLCKIMLCDMGNMPHGHAPLVGFDRPKPGPYFACTSLPKGDVKVENKTRNEETR